MLIEQLRNILILVALLIVGLVINIVFFPNNPICPDDFKDPQKEIKAFENWVDNFYTENSEATISEISRARVDFWIDNNCKGALKRYADYVAGNIDEETKQLIEMVKNETKVTKTDVPIEPKEILSLETERLIEEIIDEHYNSLYNSRRLFDSEIKKLHDKSITMETVIYSNSEIDQYTTDTKKTDTGEMIYTNTFNINEYLITIKSPSSYINKDNFYTDIIISKKENPNWKIEKTFPHINFFNQIYKVKVNKTEYYLLDLWNGFQKDWEVLIPIVYNDGVIIFSGETITDINSVARLDIDNFFTQGSELYLVLDDTRYFWNYSNINVANNATYNSAIPKIFKFDKKTGNLILSINNFNYIYKIATEKMEEDLQIFRNKLYNYASSENIHRVMNYLMGRALVPYFDYYLGINILSSQDYYNEIRNKVKKTFSEFYGTQMNEIHFDGFKDFEDI